MVLRLDATISKIDDDDVVRRGRREKALIQTSGHQGGAAALLIVDPRMQRKCTTKMQPDQYIKCNESSPVTFFRKDHTSPLFLAPFPKERNPLKNCGITVSSDSTSWDVGAL